MSLRIALFAAVLCLSALWAGGVSSRQAEKPQATRMEESPEATTMDPTQPGEHHECLKSMVGTWRITGRSWMTLSTEAVVWEGVSEKNMVLGGRFLREEVSGEMMGQPFTGIGILGYDNLMGKYLRIWIDNMSTGMALSQGTCNESGEILTFVGEHTNPVTGTKLTAKSVFSIVSEDKHIFELYIVEPDGIELKGMEISYERLRPGNR